MKNRKITITIEPDIYKELLESSRPMGFSKVSNLVRYLVLHGLLENSKLNGDSKTLQVKVDNYREILGYVKEKKFGSVEGFATYAMAQYMARFALTKFQKQRVEENNNNAD
ncbi:MAG: hypothetical protein FWB77_06240 [Treponema sp.]|nr:hypothetical protein [Treponema sp.]